MTGTSTHGPRPRGKKAQPNLTQDDVVAAAVEFVDRHGLDALTMRVLAAELEVFPTALYWHVGSKSRLLALTASRAFEEVVLPDEQALEWTDWLFEAGLRIRQVLHAHPNLAPVAGTQLVVTTTALPLVERMTGVLERAGFPGPRLVDAFNAIFGWRTTRSSPAGTPGARDRWTRATHSRYARSSPA